MSDAARITELEMALAHQERLAEELSDLARAQADRLDMLDRRMAALVARLEGLEAGAGPDPVERLPPHW